MRRTWWCWRKRGKKSNANIEEVRNSERTIRIRMETLFTVATVPDDQTTVVSEEIEEDLKVFDAGMETKESVWERMYSVPLVEMS